MCISDTANREAFSAYKVLFNITEYDMEECIGFGARQPQQPRRIIEVIIRIPATC